MGGCECLLLFKTHLWVGELFLKTLDGCNYLENIGMSRCNYFKAHLRVAVPFENTFMGGCG